LAEKSHFAAGAGYEICGMIDTYFVQRNLPHYYPAGADYFITYRLAGSIAKKTIDAMREEFANGINSEKLKKHKFKKYEDILDTSLNEPYWLKDDKFARIVADSLHFLDGKQFKLDSFSIMPNHVHVLLSHFPNAKLIPFIMRDHKKFTSRCANKILCRKGEFWESESYDHVVRNMDEFEKIRNYILNNPVKAGFVNNWEDWKWNYSR